VPCRRRRLSCRRGAFVVTARRVRASPADEPHPSCLVLIPFLIHVLCLTSPPPPPTPVPPGALLQLIRRLIAFVDRRRVCRAWHPKTPFAFFTQKFKLRHVKRLNASTMHPNKGLRSMLSRTASFQAVCARRLQPAPFRAAIRPFCWHPTTGRISCVLAQCSHIRHRKQGEDASGLQTRDLFANMSL
jgi:hypothetical protein